MVNPPPLTSAHLVYTLTPLCIHPLDNGMVDIYSGFNPRRHITTIPADTLPEWLVENNGHKEYCRTKQQDEVKRQEQLQRTNDLLNSLGL